jgi:hypothetical protein
MYSACDTRSALLQPNFLRENKTVTEVSGRLSIISDLCHSSCRVVVCQSDKCNIDRIKLRVLGGRETNMILIGAWNECARRIAWPSFSFG